MKRKIDEEWKSLKYPGVCENKYYISNYGKIFSVFKNRIIRPAKHKYGYYVATLKNADGKYAKILLHRLVAWNYVDGYSKNRCIVNHKDGDKSNTYYDNLEWVTYSENEIHSYENNLSIPYEGEGNKNPNFKYDDSIIEKICQLMENGLTNKEITQIIVEQNPDFNSKSMQGYIKTKIRPKLLRTNISSKYDF